jgi:hypothetical protein
MSARASSPSDTERHERAALNIAFVHGPQVLVPHGLAHRHFTDMRGRLYHLLTTAAQEAPDGIPALPRIQQLLENTDDTGIPAEEIPIVLAELTQGIGDATNAEWYARAIISAWNSRETLRLTSAMSTAAAAGDTHQVDTLRRKLDALRTRADGLPVPVPIADNLTPVPAFPPDLIPAPFRAWLTDAAARIGCPLEFLAVTAIVAAGAVIGRKLGIRPKERDTWTEYPVLWGALIGRPSTMKSPALTEALHPLAVLEARAREEHAAALREHQKTIARRKIERAAASDNARKAAKKGQTFDVDKLVDDDTADEPSLRRYSATKVSLQALVEILRHNPNGLLLTHDELSGLLAQLDQTGNEDLRAFFLTAWTGKGAFTLDTIGRGLNHHLPAFALSMLGGIQPARIAAHLREAVTSGAGDDGFVQRLQLAVWPDDPADWRAVDQWPDTKARRAALAVFERLDALTPANVDAETDDESETHFLRFVPEIVPSFLDWMEATTRRAKEEGATLPAMEAHIIKYRSLLPRLALTFHLIAEGRGPVTADAYTLALRWTEFLEAHARRLYTRAAGIDASLAERLRVRLQTAARERRLREPFQPRDIYRCGWAGLTEPKAVTAALDVLAAHHWILEEPAAPQTTGRPAAPQYTLHPAMHQPATRPEKSQKPVP